MAQKWSWPKNPLCKPIIYIFNKFFIAFNIENKWASGPESRKTLILQGKFVARLSKNIWAKPGPNGRKISSFLAHTPVTGRGLFNKNGRPYPPKTGSARLSKNIWATFYSLTLAIRAIKVVWFTLTKVVFVSVLTELTSDDSHNGRVF